MDNSFLAYIQQLELIAFFSGYPLVYTAVLLIATNLRLKNNYPDKAGRLLPLAYALVGTLFLGFELKKLYPDYSIENIKHTIQLPYLVVWGLLANFFWIPALGKKKILSLLHGLVFLLLIIRDLSQLLTAADDSNILKNDMKVCLSSIVLNLAAVTIILLVSFLYSRYKKAPQAANRH
ncbi:MAG: hypothetical protein JSU01_20500 [Bacteroidetes bacterium]|nr:hypothetical protein [Bacteroidota bacterium]